MSHAEYEAEISRLLNLVRSLENAVDYWKRRSEANWDLLETVSIGEKLMCETCKRYHPCDCDK